MIKGITIKLYEKTANGKDALNKTIYKIVPVEVENVLVTPMSSVDIVNNTNLYGAKGIYQLCIPKGDEHKWEDSKVEFFGKEFQTFGIVQEYIEENLPLSWNKKVSVKIYE